MELTKKDKEELLNSINIMKVFIGCANELKELGFDFEKIIDYKKIIDCIEAEKPKELYAILDTYKDKIIFNARGGCYRKREDAERKIKKLIQEDSSKDKSKYKVVVYKLCETAL